MMTYLGFTIAYFLFEGIYLKPEGYMTFTQDVEKFKKDYWANDTILSLCETAEEALQRFMDSKVRMR